MTTTTATAATFAARGDQAAQQHPDRPAVIDEAGSYSWRELMADADRIAAALQACGIGPQDSVGALLRNGRLWVAMCVAASRLGAVFVPINTWYKSAEIRWTLQHAGVKLLVSESTFLAHDFQADVLAAEPAIAVGEARHTAGEHVPTLQTVVFLDGPSAGALGWEEFLALGEHAGIPSDAGEAAALFTILYTSGSTGTPKGVMLAQASMLGNAVGIAERRGVTGEDRLWLGSPLFYGLGATNALPVVFVTGCTLVVQDAFDAGKALSMIEDNECTVFYGMSNMIRRIVQHPDWHPDRVRTLTKGNAGIEIRERRIALEEMRISRACVSWGATEVSGNAFMGHQDDPIELKLDSVGTLLPGFEAAVLDPTTGEPVAPGESGLLKIRGYTALGYLNDPEETARAFGSDGFYDTGDIVTIDADGNMRWQGRVKDVIKSGGINVSPLEIENLLLTHPAVTEAYVVGAPDDELGECAVAFVAAADGTTADDLSEHVRSIAASFKVPRHVVLCTSSSIPRTTSDKVDRPELRQQAWTLVTQAAGRVAS